MAMSADTHTWIVGGLDCTVVLRNTPAAAADYEMDMNIRLAKVRGSRRIKWKSNFPRSSRRRPSAS